ETATSAEKDGTTYTYANEYDALDAVGNGAVVVDLSDYGRIRVSGEDRIQFLHNQTTANFECLGEGQGCDTVFVTPTARTIDISHAWVMKKAVILVVSPMTCGIITEMLKKYIFFSDKVEIQDITKQTGMCALLGPKSSEILEELNLGDLVGKAYGSHKHYSVGGMPLTVAVGSIISVDGFTFMMSPDAAGSIQKALIGQGAVSMSPGAWETLRILQGRPAPGKELTEEFNVLEAGLWRAVSLNKGCYKGQETIARLVTYDGIKQRLWGIRLSSQVEPDSIITVDGKKVGKLTSYTAGTKTTGPFGLGYVKRRAASEGDSVTVGDCVVGTLVDVPFLRDQPPPPKA
ncbi:Glycine cleavage T-protein family, partial [Perilla frutescens var. hirtella]